jgi:hypothetical protein
MISLPRENDLKRYEIKLGHNRVTVQGRDVDEAIRHARAQLCRDFPRLWDVIQSMESSRFLATFIAEKRTVTQ